MIEDATSSGSRTLAPDGSPYFLSASASVEMPSSSVAVLPGCTLVTRRPEPAVSRRRLWSVASTKNLLAEYTPKPAKTFRPASEEMATMWPLPRESIPGTVAERQWSRPLQLTSTVRSHSSVCTFAIMVKYITPAQDTRMSMGPSSSLAARMRDSTSAFFVTSVLCTMTLPP